MKAKVCIDQEFPVQLVSILNNFLNTLEIVEITQSIDEADIIFTDSTERSEELRGDGQKCVILTFAEEGYSNDEIQLFYIRHIKVEDIFPVLAEWLEDVVF